MKRWTVLGVAGIGWYIPICIILGLVAGLWLDSTAQTSPLFTLLGIAFGLFMAFFGVYRMILPLIEQERGKEKS